MANPTNWAPARSNQFAYTIETGRQRLVAGCVSAPLALAMYRAALEEFFGQGVVLRHGDEVLAATY